MSWLFKFSLNTSSILRLKKKNNPQTLAFTCSIYKFRCNLFFYTSLNVAEGPGLLSITSLVVGRLGLWKQVLDQLSRKALWASTQHIYFLLMSYHTRLNENPSEIWFRHWFVHLYPSKNGGQFIDHVQMTFCHGK